MCLDLTEGGAFETLRPRVGARLDPLDRFVPPRHLVETVGQLGGRARDGV